jgi:hypothetical protein
LEKDPITVVRESLSREADHRSDRVELESGGCVDVEGLSDESSLLRVYVQTFDKVADQIAKLSIPGLIVHLDEDPIVCQFTEFEIRSPR